MGRAYDGCMAGEGVDGVRGCGEGWEGGSWVGWEEAGRCGGRRRRAVGVTGGRGLTLASLRVVADIDCGRAHKGR